MKGKFSNFMSGRYGVDELGQFASILAGLALLLSIFLPGIISRLLWIAALIGIFYAYWRRFSRKIPKRRAENVRFKQIIDEVRYYFSGMKERKSQGDEYKFFRCPSCHTMLRVPKGKGRVKIVCRKCGTSFIKNT